MDAEANNRKMYFLLQQLGYEDSVSQSGIAWRHSEGKTRDIAELSDAQVVGVAQELNATYTEACKKKRHIVLGKATALQWIVKTDESQDYSIFNKWMLSKSPYKKELYKHSLLELEKLIKQISAVNEYYQKLPKEGKAKYVQDIIEQTSPTPTTQ